MTRALIAGALLAMGCGAPQGGTHQDGAPTGPTGVVVSGWVTRSVAVMATSGGDGRGTIYLSLADACANNSGPSGQSKAALAVPGADLSADGSSVPFAFAGIPDGTYQLTGFLDDVTSAGQREGYPGLGDLVSFGTIAPRCVEVRVRGQAVTDVRLDLNYVMPFDLPGPTGNDAPPAHDIGPLVDGDGRFSISGVVTRSVEPGLGGDGKGTLYMLVSKSCMSTSGNPSDILAYITVPDADLTAKQSQVPFTLTGLANGVHQLNGYLDDVPSAKPLPGIGDLVSFGGIGPKCTEVVVNGADVTGVVFDLNMVMMFDL